MESKAKALGLTWPRGKPIWRPSRPAIKAGFTPKWINLSCFADDEAALTARCQRLTAEMHDWLSGRRGRDPVFDGTIGSLIRFYQVEPNSPYHRLAPSSRHPYDAYIRMIANTVGARRIDALDGRDLSRWHAEWSRPITDDGKPRIAAARMAMTVLKTALSFGISCRLPGCAELKLILQQQRSQHQGHASKHQPPLRSPPRARPRMSWGILGRLWPMHCSSRARCGNGTSSANGCRSRIRRPR
jgi:hypothetical protein